MRKTSDAQMRAISKYKTAHYEHVGGDMPIGTRERWKAAAAGKGESLTEYIRRAVEDRIAREQESAAASPAEPAGAGEEPEAPATEDPAASTGPPRPRQAEAVGDSRALSLDPLRH